MKISIRRLNYPLLFLLYFLLGFRVQRWLESQSSGVHNLLCVNNFWDFSSSWGAIRIFEVGGGRVAEQNKHLRDFDNHVF